MPELIAIEEWKALSKLDENNLDKACFESLVKTVGAIIGHRGALYVDQQLVAKIVTNMACNTYLADLIHEFIEPFWEQAINVEGYQYLPSQKSPVIMNVKGASASGKSTIRPHYDEQKAYRRWPKRALPLLVFKADAVADAETGHQSGSPHESANDSASDSRLDKLIS